MVQVASHLGGFLPGAEPKYLVPGSALHICGTYRAGERSSSASSHDGHSSHSEHGHSHGRLRPQARQFDVGVDAWDFRPVTLAELKGTRR